MLLNSAFQCVIAFLLQYLQEGLVFCLKSKKRYKCYDTFQSYPFPAFWKNCPSLSHVVLFDLGTIGVLMTWLGILGAICVKLLICLEWIHQPSIYTCKLFSLLKIQCQTKSLSTSVTAMKSHENVLWWLSKFRKC